jgi:hypothetical protein
MMDATMHSHAPREALAAIVARLDAIDAIRAGEPQKAHAEFGQAAAMLIDTRNDVIERLRAGRGAAGERLLRDLNSLVSLAVSIEYPLSGFHWPRVKKLRDGIAHLVNG